MNRTFSIFMPVILVCICIIFCGSLTAIHAENASEAANIRAMSHEEKLKLWNSFSEEKKEAIRKKARSMSEQKFKQLKNNFSKIEKFAPDEQQRVRNNFMRMRNFEPEQQKRVKENFRRFKKLPQEQKQFYRKQFRRKPNIEKRPGLNENLRKPGSDQRRNFRQNDGQEPRKPDPKPMQRQFNNRGPGNFNRTGEPENIRKDVPPNTRPANRPGKLRPGPERNGPGKLRLQQQRDLPEKPNRPNKPQRPAKQNSNPDLKNRPARPFRKP